MSDYACRSLLQKAIRRGQSEIFQKVLPHLEQSDGFLWVRNRSGVILSEENYSHLALLAPHASLSEISDLFIKTTLACKQKDAFALASLAFWAQEGVQKISLPPHQASLLEEYMQACQDFTAWGKNHAKTLKEMEMIKNALQASRRASFPADKAFPLAAAFLFLRNHNPAPRDIIAPMDLPLWVALDKHTGEGRIALDKASSKLRIPPQQVYRVNFWRSGVYCNDSLVTPFTLERKRLALAEVGLDGKSADQMWEKVLPVFLNFLSRDLAEFTSHIDSLPLLEIKPDSSQLALF